jgi:isoaspartyl peptidase/L-asparaginase-like protein (Ntn-hydrolase superfamily)
VSGFAFAVHGGAGARARRTPGEESEVRRALAACVAEAYAALARGASAVDVVERAVARLEDDPHFNAGRGSALTLDGRVEMDASIMDGRSRAAGAVAAVTRVANPVSAARLVMERSRHVLLVGEAADRFALAHGARAADAGSLVTDERRRELEALRAKQDADGAQGGRASAEGARSEAQPSGDRRAGTVGAVARDAQGHLAAATSTGGLAGQLPGRVGDSALIGAGTWADDQTCAVSGTGHGEAFVRCALAHEIDALVRLLRMPLDTACEAALARLAELGFAGGLIAVGGVGEPILRFRSAAMARGWLDADGRPRVAIGADE